MSDIKKIKRTAMVLSIVAGLVILWFTFQQVRGAILTIGFGTDVLGGVSADLYWFFAISFVNIPIILASLIISFSLLNSIRKEETPFTIKNTTKLKVVALLLVAYEITVIISQYIIHNVFLRYENPDHGTVMETSLGGIVIVLGLVVYCIALVFEYGISLQNQVDETL
jgi:hypothetical protein